MKKEKKKIENHKNWKLWKNWKNASFTVETAMIMGLVLLVLMTVLEGGFYVYHRAVETAKEYERIISESEETPNPVTQLRQMQSIGDIVENVSEKE